MDDNFQSRKPSPPDISLDTLAQPEPEPTISTPEIHTNHPLHYSPTSPHPSSSDSSMSSALAALLPVLHCPQCDPPAPLVNPTTLRCGHTICARHIEHPDAPDHRSVPSSPSQPSRILEPSCPIPSCRPLPRISDPTAPSSSSSSSTPHPSRFAHSSHVDIPRSSRVVFLPPRNPNPFSPPSTINKVVKVRHAPTDVMLSKVLSLVRQCSKSPSTPPDEDEDHLVPLHAPSDDEISDDEEDDLDQSESVDEVDPIPTKPRHPHPASSMSVPSLPMSQINNNGSISGSFPEAHRPRKRRRQKSPTNLPPIPPPPLPSTAKLDAFNKDLVQELTCEICYMLVYKPLTTPCQHTFCAKCLQRSLDHSDKCPLCRQTLPSYSFFHDHPVNKVILSLILKAFSELYEERGEQIETEDRDARLDTPIFVCQLSFPGMPTLLHFFEPRYRLMLRRCLEQPIPCFGMIMPPQPGGTTDYGTMLEIRSVQMLPEGRSMVETWGSYRFRILERGTFDGYMVGRVERIDDVTEDLESEVERIQRERRIREQRSVASSSSSSQVQQQEQEQQQNLPPPQPPPTPPVQQQQQQQQPTPPEEARPQATSTDVMGPVSASAVVAAAAHALGTTNLDNTEPSNEELMAICHSFVEQLRSGMAPWVVQRLNHTYGPMPSDISDFTFWMGLILPIDEREKAKLLPIRSPRLRLRLLVHWIEQLNSQWWFMNGCTVL